MILSNVPGDIPGDDQILDLIQPRVLIQDCLHVGLGGLTKLPCPEHYPPNNRYRMSKFQGQ